MGYSSHQEPGGEEDEAETFRDGKYCSREGKTNRGEFSERMEQIILWDERAARI
jgi:hypothetical protein